MFLNVLHDVRQKLTSFNAAVQLVRRSLFVVMSVGDVSTQRCAKRYIKVTDDETLLSL